MADYNRFNTFNTFSQLANFAKAALAEEAMKKVTPARTFKRYPLDSGSSSEDSGKSSAGNAAVNDPSVNEAGQQEAFKVSGVIPVTPPVEADEASKAAAAENEMALQDITDGLMDHDTLVRSIIYSEILGKPKSRKNAASPHFFKGR